MTDITSCGDDGKGNLIHNNQTPKGSPVKNCGTWLNEDFSGGYLVGLQSAIYYVGITGRGTRALYRSLNLGQPEELVEGIESLRVMFGVGPASTQVAEQYLRPTAIWGGTSSWDNVRSARLQLLVSSPNKNTLPTANPVEFSPGGDFYTWAKDSFMTWADGNYSTTDGRWRQVYSTTAAVRNRLP
jgi:hypothetical protein